MTTNRRRRADLDDEDLPEFVTERTAPEKVVPHCVRCGAECPAAKELHTLCGTCCAREDDLFGVRQVSKAEAIAQLHARFATREAERPPDSDEAINASDPVRYHQARLQAQGLSEGGALMHAREMVADPPHVAECPVCQRCPDPGRRLRERREESARLSRQGLEIIGPAVERLLKQNHEGFHGKPKRPRFERERQ